MSRVIIMVLDSVGIGNQPDAYMYGDAGANTLKHVIEKTNIELPNLVKLGLGNIQGIDYIKPAKTPIGCFGSMKEASKGKDTTTGHWEIAGLILDEPFPVYPNGFPKEIVAQIEKTIGRKALGNYPASGTVIIEELGKEHMETGYPIIYTSADSVLQVAAHEEIISKEELYKICTSIREIMQGEHAVGRIIARPFVGQAGTFKRTTNRQDFSLDPIGETFLDFAKKSKLKVVSVGKIYDIFNGRGITDSFPVKGNKECLNKTIELVQDDFDGVIFTNLVDFDMNYGHRNDVEGYASALVEFDRILPDILEGLKEKDIIIFTADHGCDPTTPGTDHTRETVPLLVYGKSIRAGVDLGLRDTFADVGATGSEYLNIDRPANGRSFLSEII